jgi:hypothetical protein
VSIPANATMPVRIVGHWRNSKAEAKTVLSRVVSIVKGTEVSLNDLEQAKAFVDAITKNAPLPASGENAVYVYRVLKGIKESIKTYAPITIS